MYDQLRSEYESVKRSAIQPATNFYSRNEPDLFSNQANILDRREAVRKGNYFSLKVAERQYTSIYVDSRILFHEILIIILQNTKEKSHTENNTFGAKIFDICCYNETELRLIPFLFQLKYFQNQLTYFLQIGGFSLLKLQDQRRIYGQQDRIVQTLVVLLTSLSHRQNKLLCQLMLWTEGLVLTPCLELELATPQRL